MLYLNKSENDSDSLHIIFFLSSACVCQLSTSKKVLRKQCPPIKIYFEMIEKKHCYSNNTNKVFPFVLLTTDQLWTATCLVLWNARRYMVVFSKILFSDFNPIESSLKGIIQSTTMTCKSLTLFNHHTLWGSIQYIRNKNNFCDSIGSRYSTLSTSWNCKRARNISFSLLPSAKYLPNLRFV